MWGNSARMTRLDRLRLLAPPPGTALLSRPSVMSLSREGTAATCEKPLLCIGEGSAATRGEEPQLYMVMERRLRVVRSRSYTSVRERRLRVVRERRLRMVRERRLRVVRSRNYAWRGTAAMRLRVVRSRSYTSVRERRLRVVRERRLRVVRSRTYAW